MKPRPGGEAGHGLEDRIDVIGLEYIAITDYQDID